MLVCGLPPDSATFRQDQPAWSQHDELIATSIEVTDAWGRQMVAALVAVNGGKVTLPEPLRIAHPDRPKKAPAKGKKPRLATSADVGLPQEGR